jgi:aspartate/methionine/tyrosine aminotransferase
MDYKRMPIEVESPEQKGYASIDCNLAESSVSDTRLNLELLQGQEIDLLYGDHWGHGGLRKLIAEEYGMHEDEILLTPGAAGALFIISTTLLEPTSNLLVEWPNYATNIETPRAIGCNIDQLMLKEVDGFHAEKKVLEEMLSKRKYDLISITQPHNPTGRMFEEASLKYWVEVSKNNGSLLLVDETYRDLSLLEKTSVAASLSSHVITVSSVSKAFGLPGLRIGWIACKNKELMEKFLAAKEQIIICNSILDETLAYVYYKRKKEHFIPIQKRIQNNLKVYTTWIHEHPSMKGIAPMGGVVAFPRITANVDIKKFYQILEEKYKTMVGPGHWFEMPDEYMRIGFGWPTEEQFERGLKNIDLAIKESLIA